MTTKIMNMFNKMKRRGSGANLNLIRYAAMVVVLLLGVSDAWGGDTYYYAKVTAKVASTGGGKVYASSSSSAPAASSYTDAAAGSTAQNSNKNNGVTLYVFASAKNGYTFAGWSKTDGETDCGTDSPYGVESGTAGISTSDGVYTEIGPYYAAFNPVTLGEVGGTLALNPTSASASFNGSFTIATNADSADDFGTPSVTNNNTNNGTFSVTGKSVSNGVLTINYTFNRNDAFGTNGASVTVISAGGENSKQVTLTANSVDITAGTAQDLSLGPNDATKDGEGTFTTAGATSKDGFSAAFSNFTNGSTADNWSATVKSYANNTIIVSYTFTKGSLGQNTYSATLTLTAPSGDTQTVTVNASVEESITNDAEIVGTSTKGALSTLIGSAADGATIRLIRNNADISVTDEIVISKNLTIDLNGKTINDTQAAAKSVFKFTGSGKTLIIMDSKAGGKINRTASYAGHIYGIYVTAGTLKIQSGTVRANNTMTGNASSRAEAIWAEGGKTEVSGGTVEALSANTMSYGFYGNKAEATIEVTGGTITASSTNTMARGIYTKGAVTISGGSVSGSAVTDSYGVYFAGATLNVTGGSITASSTGSGDCKTFGVNIGTGATANIANANITAANTNASSSYLYGVYSSAATTTIINSEIEATSDGGTVYAIRNESGAMNIFGGTYTTNAKATARALLLYGNTTIYSGTFNANTTEGDDAVVLYLGSTGTGSLIVNGGTFNATSEAQKAYGVFGNNVNSTITINNGTFNTTATSATAYGVYPKGTTYIHGGKFKTNANGAVAADVAKNGEPTFELDGGLYQSNTNLADYAKSGLAVKALLEDFSDYKAGYRYCFSNNPIAAQITPVCKIGTKEFETLEEALNYVNLNDADATIVMTANYTLPAGRYTLPANAKLLVPREEAQMAFETNFNNIVRYNVYSTPSAFRTLTFASGVQLDVLGEIQVASLVSTKGQMNGNNGTPTGTHGKIVLQENSKIILENKAKLYAWGYITGDGMIDAKKGSFVYECMQIRDWRGGTNTSNIYERVFPFNQYFIQNVESRIRFRPGAEETIHGAVNASSSAYPVYAKLIGTSGAMFLMDDKDASEDTWVQKSYDYDRDYQVYEVNSGAKLNSLTVSGLPMVGSVSTSGYNLPLVNNMHIHLLTGKLEVIQSLLMQPGVIIEIDKEAKCVVASGKKIYVQDSEDTQEYYISSSANGPFNTVAYSPQGSVSGKRTLTDASIDIHGTFEFNGYLYTSEHGANIFSTNEDAGTIIFKNASPSNDDVNICNYGGTVITKTFTTPQLKNADGETPAYRSTSGSVTNDEYAYYVNQWRKWVSSGCFAIDKSDNNNWKYFAKPAEYVELVQNTPFDEDHLYHTVNGRFLILDADNCQWWDVEKMPEDNTIIHCLHPDNDTYYTWNGTKWVEKLLTVTWKNYDGSTLKQYTKVRYNSTPEYLDALPTHPFDAASTYEFMGWTPTPAPLRDDATYTATFEQYIRKYTITFNDASGNLIESAKWEYGAVPVCQNTPTGLGIDYEWNKPIVSVTEDATYTLQAKPQVAIPTYTIKFLNYDNSVIETRTDVPIGTTLTDIPVATRTATASTSYTFDAWSPALAPVSADATYIATFTETTRKYTISVDVNGSGATPYINNIQQASANLEYGSDAVVEVRKGGYHLVKWTDNKVTNPRRETVTGDATYTVSSMAEDDPYSITYRNVIGATNPNTITSYTYSTPTIDLLPAQKTDYVFGGWYDNPKFTGSTITSIPQGSTGSKVLYAKFDLLVATVTEGSTTTECISFAEALTTAEGKTNPTITLYRDVAVTSQIELNNAMTIDLNGHTISSTQTAVTTGVFKINASGKTVTITDSGTGGKIDHTASCNGYMYGIWLAAGSLQIDGGTIYAKNNAAANDSYRSIGVWADGSAAAVTMSAGKIEAEGKNMVFGAYLNNTTCNLTMTGGEISANGTTKIRGIYIQKVTTLTNATITATATSTDSRTFFIKSGTNLTINSGTYTATGATGSVYVITEQSGATVTINGGRFSATDKEIYKEGGTLSIKGGVYVHNTDLEANCATNCSVYDLTSGTDYNDGYRYEVAGMFTLNWVTDGDELTGDYTSGSTKSGTAIIAPNTPTKTGYTFAGWNNNYTGVMPAANTTYTAQWTINSHNLIWDMDGGQTSSTTHTTGIVTYGSAITYPANNTMTKENYVFSGWSTNASTMPDEDLTITAQWTPAVASVTANDVTTYYTTVPEAFTAANGKTNATVTMLDDVTITSQIEITKAMTIDLNGKTISSTQAAQAGVFKIIASGKTVTISDSGTNGKISHIASYSGHMYGVWLSAGSLNITGGTIYANNTITTDNTGYRAYGIWTDGGSSITISEGTVEGKSQNMAFGIYSGNACAITMTGGSIISSGTKSIRGIYTQGTTTLTDATITVTATDASSNCCAFYAKKGAITIHSGTYSASGAGSCYVFTIPNEGQTMSVTINGGRFNGATREVNKSGASGTVSISGGYYAHNTDIQGYCTTNHYVFGLEEQSPYLYEVAAGYTLSWATDGDALTGNYTSGVTKVGSSITAPNTPTKTGYTFDAWNNAYAGIMPAANTTYTAIWTPNTNTAYSVKHYQQNIANDDYTLFETENLTGTTATNVTPEVKLYEGFTAPSTQTEAIAADGSLVINYYYTRNSYTLTWEADGGNLSGTYTSGLVKYGAPIIAPTVTWINHNFEGWNETPASVMPAADITYTASWSVSSYTLTWNANGGVLSGEYTSGEVAYGTTIVKPTVTRENYVFNGWTPTVPATMPDADATFTASWTAAAAAVTADDITTYYKTVPEAFTAANSKNSDVTIKLLKNADVTSTTSSTPLLYSKAYTCTFDLNNHTITGTTGNAGSNPRMIYINHSNATFIVTDNSSAKGGKISMVRTGARGRYYAIQVAAGSLIVNGGTISADNQSKPPINTANDNTQTWAVDAIRLESGTSLQVIGGTIEAKAFLAPRAIDAYSGGTNITISDGLLKATVTSTASNSSSCEKPKEAIIVYVTGGTTTISGGKFLTTSSNTNATVAAINDAATAANVSIQGGYYSHNTNLSKYKATGYQVKGTTAADKASVGNEYNYKLDNLYTITWQLDGVNVRTDEVAYGETPEYGETPTKASTAQYDYSFAGWTPSIHTVNGDQTYSGSFNAAVRNYLITFVNDDNTTVLQQGNADYGVMPEYTGETPTTTKTDGIYAFAGWSPEVTEVSGATTYTAQYNKLMDLVVEEGETLNVETTSEVTTTTIHVAGTVHVAEGKALTTDDLILEATPTTSGEITGAGMVNVTTNAYFHFSQAGGAKFKAKTWYAVAVPWQVNVPANVLGDVYTKVGEGEFVQQKLGKTFDLIYYDGERRAQGATKAWNYVEDDPAADQVMYPGRAYMIYLASDADVIRFKKNNETLIYTNVPVARYESTIDGSLSDWNGIANPAIYKAYLNVGATENKAQVYNPDTKQYEWFDMSENQLQVGQPIFVQSTVEGTIVANASTYSSSLAPRRANGSAETMTRYEVVLTASEGEASDRIIVRMDEDKEADKYIVGQDLAKMGVSSVVPQMWIDRYNSKMCIQTAIPTNNKATYPLSLFAPAAGEYMISIQESEFSNQNDMLYLTYDNRIIWNLTYAPYMVSLNMGTDTHYGLKIVRSEAPAVTTDIEGAVVDAHGEIRKVIIDEKVYIIRGGEIYTITGAKVQ